MIRFYCNKETEARLIKIKSRLGFKSTAEVLKHSVDILEAASREEGTTVIIKTPTTETHINIPIKI